jgi:hypothetical protein
MLEVIACLALLGDERRFFERRDVDFWDSRRRAAEPQAELWSDSPAPPPVRRLLEAPSAENARAYLAWQEERFKRLRAAMAAVDTARGAKTAGSLLYFARDGCRWCALQEEELQGLPVVRVPAGSPLWKEYGVTVTPTLVVDGKVLRGLTTRAALLKELRHE